MVNGCDWGGQLMESGATGISPNEALGRTDRSLRRIVRTIQQADIADEKLEAELRRARRQLRANKALLVDEAESEKKTG
jgi:hypothetical protein